MMNRTMMLGAGNVAYDIPSIAAGESYQKGDIVEFAGYLQGKNPNLQLLIRNGILFRYAIMIVQM